RRPRHRQRPGEGDPPPGGVHSGAAGRPGAGHRRGAPGRGGGRLGDAVGLVDRRGAAAARRGWAARDSGDAVDGRRGRSARLAVHPRPGGDGGVAAGGGAPGLQAPQPGDRRSPFRGGSGAHALLRPGDRRGQVRTAARPGGAALAHRGDEEEAGAVGPVSIGCQPGAGEAGRVPGGGGVSANHQGAGRGGPGVGGGSPGGLARARDARPLHRGGRWEMSKTRGQCWTDLLVAARDGDPAAFDGLMGEAPPGLRHTPYESLHDRALAEDLASKVFVRAWKHLKSFDPERGSAATLLYKILRNLLIDAGRKITATKGREVSGFEAPAAGEDGEEAIRVEPEDDLGPAPPDEADRPRTRALLEEAMRRLPESDRRILRLFYFEQMTYEEVAGQLGIGVKAVGPRLTRARDKLRELVPGEAAG